MRLLLTETHLHLLWEGRALDHFPPERRFGIDLIDVLSTGPAAPREREHEFIVGDA